MTTRAWSGWLVLGTLLALAALAWTQRPAQGTLTVNGQPGEAPVIQVNGRSYVELEALARLTNSSLAFNGNQVSLSLPGPAPMAPPAGTLEGAPVRSEFSKEFLRAGIEEMAVIREWRSAVLSAVQNGYPVTEEWMSGYQGLAVKDLRLASLAATTASDRNALQLLGNEVSKMERLSDQVVAARKAMKYLPPDSLNDDPLNQQILTCARALASMAASGAFQDDGSCH